MRRHISGSRPLGMLMAALTALSLLSVLAAPAGQAQTPAKAGPQAQAARPGSPGPVLSGQRVAVAHHEGRTSRTFDFDAGWRFALVNSAAATDPTGAYANAATPGYDDSSWRAVTLPHDWSIELNPTSGPGTSSGTGFYQGGLGWYRKSFTLPRDLTGKDVAVQFDGVYMDSEIYLNGKLLGTHHYGYTGFSLDLTGAHTDGKTTNVLAVKVRNDIPTSRWYSGSGIYRNVRLVATDPVHVERNGMAVSTPDLAVTSKAGYGVARVATTIAGVTGTSSKIKITSTVRDAKGAAVGSASGVVTSAAAPVTGSLDVRVAAPHLWNVTNPYLYTVSTQLRLGSRVVDTYVSRMGFRWTTFDPQAGFSLNGTAMKLHGVDLHHDQGALGSATNYDAVLRQMQVMKSMGVNAVRTSHNPPSPELVEVCEQLGIMLMVEAFDTWNVAKVANDYARFFTADSDADIAEMVRASRNSPAVIMWSIGNEIPNSASAAAVPIARRLIDDVRAQDPTRPVVIGSDKYRSVPATGSALEQILLMLDGVGLNYNTAASVDALHTKYPKTFFFESESSSETSTRGDYDQPEQLNTGENYTPGRRGESSYDNNLSSWTMSAEYALRKDRDRPWFLGQFLWSGFDYIGEPAPFDVFPVKTSSYGAVDTAGFAKDQYYLFKSQWTTTPMVHLVPTNWTDHTVGEPVQVWAYSNADSVELFLNGRSLGVHSFDHKVTTDGRKYLETTEATGDDRTVTAGKYPGSYTDGDGTAGHLRLTWTVPYQGGQLVAVARNGSTVVARDEVSTAGAPAAVKLSLDRAKVSADGRSLVYVTGDVVDRHGVLVPNADNLVHFSVTNGRLIGVDNGRQESAESYKAPYRTAFHGKVLAIVSPTGAGKVTVSAVSSGLKSGRAVVTATAPTRQDLGGQGAAPVTWTTPNAPITAVPPTAAGDNGLTADASFSGAATSLPDAMVDGVTASGGWSNAYTKVATALLATTSAARPADWVSLNLPTTRLVGGMSVRFLVDAQRSLPATVRVSYWKGGRWRPATGTVVDLAAGSTQPSTITFEPVRTTALRLDLTSAHPEAANGFLGIAELAPVAG